MSRNVYDLQEDIKLKHSRQLQLKLVTKTGEKNAKGDR